MICRYPCFFRKKKKSVVASVQVSDISHMYLQIFANKKKQMATLENEVEFSYLRFVELRFWLSYIFPVVGVKEVDYIHRTCM